MLLSLEKAQLMFKLARGKGNWGQNLIEQNITKNFKI
jgi:hypothetical protein